MAGETLARALTKTAHRQAKKYSEDQNEERKF